jgi:hypothetical protein
MGIFYHYICLLLAVFLVITPLAPYAAVDNTTPSLTLIAPGTDYAPAVIKGLKLYPDQPFNFDFIIDKGNSKLSGEALKEETAKMVEYFLAALTIARKDIWVNLSPYEQGRIIPEKFSQTKMGMELLAQDYLLKQLAASLTNPASDLGRKFWQKIDAKALSGTLSKVWIIPDKAVVYEGKDTAYIVESHLKVMTQDDYRAMQNNNVGAGSKPAQDKGQVTNLPLQSFRQNILPLIEKEVNHGENFAPLRQICNSLILALWYKENLTQTLLNKEYSNQNKVKGIDTQDSQLKERIYARYVEAYTKGAYDHVKTDYDRARGQTARIMAIDRPMNIGLNPLFHPNKKPSCGVI